MSDLNFIDWYANEDKIINAFINDENEPYVEVNDMNEVINGQYQAKKQEIKKQQSENGVPKSVIFRSPLTTKDQSPSVSSNSAIQGRAATAGRPTNGPIQNRSAANQRTSPTQSRPSFMEIVRQCKIERTEPKLKSPIAPLITKRSPQITKPPTPITKQSPSTAKPSPLFTKQSPPITKRSPLTTGEQAPLIKRPAEPSSLTKHSAAINTALHLNFEQFKFQENSDTFFDYNMLHGGQMNGKTNNKVNGQVNSKEVKRRSPIEERKVEVNGIRPAYQQSVNPSHQQSNQSNQQPLDQSHQQPSAQSNQRSPDQSNPQPINQSNKQPLDQSSKRPSPQRSPTKRPQQPLSEPVARFKRSLPDSDVHLPPKKRLLRKWMIENRQTNSHIEVAVRGEPDIVLLDDFDFGPLDAINEPMSNKPSVNSELSMREDYERTETEVLHHPAAGPSAKQPKKQPKNQPKNQQPSNKITDFFQPRKSTNNSPNPSQAANGQATNGQATNGQAANGQSAVGDLAKEFTYFKPPQIVPIKPDQRLENNSGYQILIDKYSDLFDGIQHFNEVQIGSISLVFESDDSFVLKATTSSGKSTVLEFAIIKLLHELKSTAFKVILIEPMKAIINEKYKSWKKFAKYGLQCCVLTADTKYDPELVASCSLIICTPEAAEELTRNTRELDVLTKNLRLVLIGEIRFLSDQKRGHCLEAFICRLKMNCRLTGSPVRFIAASSTVGNLDSVCRFFGENTKKIKFGEESRIVPLEKVVIGYDFPQSYNEFKFDKILTDHLMSVLNTYQKGQQVQIFCPTRKVVEQTAEHLRKGNFARFVSNQREMQQLANKIGLQELKECFQTGVSYHHSGLPAKDKALIEQAFKKNLTNVLVCTTSLAVGINLPSNVIIIKGTFRYINSNFIQYSESDIAQMIARAGRQQKVANPNHSAGLVGISERTNKATVVIMTKNCYKAVYERMLNESLESRLRNHLCEYINAEVILGHLGSFDDVLDYIRRSYLYLRLKANPELYSIPKNADADVTVRRWVENILKELQTHQVIKLAADQSIERTEIGKIMSQGKLSLRTLKSFGKMDQTSIGGILHFLCNCPELTDHANLRNDEKAALSELNKGNNLRFPIRNKGTYKIQDLDQKINCLIQAELADQLTGGPNVQTNFGLDAYSYAKIARRLAKALLDLMYIQQPRRATFSTFRSAVMLSKSLNAGIWDDSQRLTKQFPKIGTVLCGKLTEAGYTSFERLRNARSSDIEMICGRNPPFGDDLLTQIHRVPEYELKIIQQSQCGEMFKAELTVRIELKNYYRQPEGDAWLIVGDEEDTLLFAKKIAITMFDTADHTIEFEYMVSKAKSGKLNFCLINDSVVGADCLIDYLPKYTGVARK